MARVISLGLSLAVMVALLMTTVDAGKKQKGHVGYQAPQKVIILPAGPSQTYAWLGHCPPKGKCKHIPYVKRPPFPSFHPPAPPVSYTPITFAYPAPPPSGYQAYAPQPSAAVYSAPAPYEAAPVPAYSPPAPSYSQPDYSQSGYSSQQAPLDFVPSAPIYAAQEVITPYSAPSPQGYAAPAPQDYAAPAPQDYSAPAPQDYSAPAPQDYSAPAPQDYSAPAPQDYSASAPQDYSASAPQDYSAPASVQEYSAPAPQEYSAPAPVQEYSAPPQQEYSQEYSAPTEQYAVPVQQENLGSESSGYGSDPSAASIATPQVAFSEPESNSQSSYVSGDASIVPAGYEAAAAPAAELPVIDSAAPAVGSEVQAVEEQTVPSWGAIPDPFGDVFSGADNFGAPEAPQFESIGINQPESQSYASSDNLQAVQVDQEANFGPSNWESIQSIDGFQSSPISTFAPEEFASSSYNFQEQQPVEQSEPSDDIVPLQSSPVDNVAYESELSIQQEAEAGDYSEISSYGARIRPRGAIQQQQRLRRQF